MKSTAIVLMAALIALGGIALGGPRALAGDAAAACARVGNDDAVHRYAPSLRAGFANAYRRLFPEAGRTPDRAILAGASYRCMGGKLVACFTGANLPCAKIATARTNAGAEAFCREPANRDQDIVPMVATGHDSLYSYRCRKGRAIVSGTNWDLDARGFARTIWAPMD